LKVAATNACKESFLRLRSETKFRKDKTFEDAEESEKEVIPGRFRKVSKVFWRWTSSAEEHLVIS
jgi:hypothetical protein